MHYSCAFAFFCFFDLRWNRVRRLACRVGGRFGAIDIAKPITRLLQGSFPVDPSTSSGWHIRTAIAHYLPFHTTSFLPILLFEQDNAGNHKKQKQCIQHTETAFGDPRMFRLIFFPLKITKRKPIVAVLNRQKRQCKWHDDINRRIYKLKLKFIKRIFCNKKPQGG